MVSAADPTPPVTKSVDEDIGIVRDRADGLPRTAEEVRWWSFEGASQW
jgi:hypothetical protein